MNSSRSLKTVALISVTAAATTLLIQACGGGAMAQSSDADPIEGVWDSTVTVKDCASGAVATTFKAFVMLHRGGTMQVDTSPPRATRGDIYGNWKNDAVGTYSANAVHLRFNPDTSLAGTNKIKRSLTLAGDGKSFTATLAIDVLDTAGAVVGKSCASEAAVRA